MITVTDRGVVDPTCQTRRYSPSRTTSSDPSAVIQIGAVSGAALNSSILSTSSAVAADIWRLPIFARIVNENTAAAATSPHATIPAVTNASIRVNPRVVFKGLHRERGRAPTTLKRCH